MLQRHRAGPIFQQDDAAEHTSHVSRTFLQQNHVHVLVWKSKSAKMSPIEHVWVSWATVGRVSGRQSQQAV